MSKILVIAEKPKKSFRFIFINFLVMICREKF